MTPQAWALVVRVVMLGLPVLTGRGQAAVPRSSQDVLSLAECLRIMHGDHPTLTQSRENLRSRKLDIVRARASFFPRIDASLGADLWRRSPGQPLEGVFPGTDLKPRSSLSASWNVLGAKNPLEYARSRIQREEAEGLLKDIERSLESALVSAYFDLLESQEVLRLRRKVYTLEEEEFAIVRKRVQMGSSGPLRRITGEEELLRTELTVSQAEAARHQAAADLTLLLGTTCDPEQKLESLDDAAFAEEGREEDWLATARRHRDDLAARRAAVRVARKNVSLALWDRLPDVNVGVQYAFNPDPFYGVGRRPFRSESIDQEAAWAFGVGLNLPIFTGGSLKARYAQSRSSLDRSRASMDFAERQVERDVRAAWARYKVVRSTFFIRQKELELMQERFRYIERLYQTGARYQKVDWSRARVDVARREVSLVQARVQARESWVRLLRSTGLPLDARGPVEISNSDGEDKG